MQCLIDITIDWMNYTGLKVGQIIRIIVVIWVIFSVGHMTIFSNIAVTSIAGDYYVRKY